MTEIEVLADTFPYLPAGRDCEGFFHDFLLALRAHPALEKTHIILCGERNTGHDVHYLSEILSVFSSKSIISQKGTDDEGWWTDSFNKQRQLDSADHALGCRQVRILENWATAASFAKEDPETRRKKLSAQLESELKRYGEHEKPTSDPSSAPRVFISGRVAEDGTREDSLRDDLAFCTCFSIWLCWLVMRRIAPGVDYQSIFGLPIRPEAGKRKR